MNTPAIQNRSLYPSGPRPEDRRPHVVVVGGGIAGLSAAAHLSGVADGTASGALVTVLESAGRLGGKLLRAEVGGLAVDLGAEAVFVRRPAALELARQVGLGHELEPPSTMEAAILTRGKSRPLPMGHLLGIPGDLRALAACGILSRDGLIRACWDLQLPRTQVGDDIAIGRYVAARMGREVVDRMVEPLLGGIYAGHADHISMRATLPGLLAAARDERSLVESIHRMRRPDPGKADLLAPKPPGHGAPPPFRTVRGGMGRLPLALARACRSAGVDIRTGVEVRDLERVTHGWALTVHHAGRAQRMDADAVVLAVPAPAAARLLARQAPSAAAVLRAVEYADTALITLVFERSDLAALPHGSGLLVPPVDGRLVKAVTFSSNKWSWPGRYAPDKFVVRVSVGRHGEDTAVVLDDQELVARSRTELAQATGLFAAPCDTAVTRWRTGLPQYAVGHVTRMEHVHEQVRKLGTLAVCGAAYDGVGITACVEGAQRAAAAITASLPARVHSI
ncbi:protoporphyrinogen oxidase [Streptomyces sp. NPDC060232]|uniref:protoporphyrinogen oxidase n=1 Tax=Streptomyces sp. NPDC060232 TaxID=3347079 RepID=UPI0036476312